MCSLQNCQESARQAPQSNSQAYSRQYCTRHPPPVSELMVPKEWLGSQALMSLVHQITSPCRSVQSDIGHPSLCH
ncbi:hypothetical protein GMOD_00001274 [Pyrenophora seminiperda CCB06]|uniref:Uncharacterized protein n=1 Tax=Pyrenophora seminiperda CCB06 TaxID=1302712 RepID=A0A3M7LYV7_9PLEO|nr:hypothetical protein GMOD_00001274 [Pyrenophora seminiperda CCB06]